VIVRAPLREFRKERAGCARHAQALVVAQQRRSGGVASARSHIRSIRSASLPCARRTWRM